MKMRSLTIGLMTAVLGSAGAARGQSEARPDANELDVLIAPQNEDGQQQQLRVERLPAPNADGPSYRLVTKSPHRAAGYLGVAVSAAPPALSHQLRLAEGVGLVVDQVLPGSPAQKAGIQQYDLLVKLDDQKLVNPEQLVTLVKTFKPGREVTLEIVREGERQTLSATLSANNTQPMFGVGQPSPDGKRNRLRLRFAPPAPDQAQPQYRPVPPNLRGPFFQRQDDPQPQYRVVPKEQKPTKKAKPHGDDDQDDEQAG